MLKSSMIGMRRKRKERVWTIFVGALLVVSLFWGVTWDVGSAIKNNDFSSVVEDDYFSSWSDSNREHWHGHLVVEESMSAGGESKASYVDQGSTVEVLQGATFAISHGKDWKGSWYGWPHTYYPESFHRQIRIGEIRAPSGARVFIEDIYAYTKDSNTELSAVLEYLLGVLWGTATSYFTLALPLPWGLIRTTNDIEIDRGESEAVIKFNTPYHMSDALLGAYWQWHIIKGSIMPGRYYTRVEGYCDSVVTDQPLGTVVFRHSLDTWGWPQTTASFEIYRVGTGAEACAVNTDWIRTALGAAIESGVDRAKFLLAQAEADGASEDIGARSFLQSSIMVKGESDKGTEGLSEKDLWNKSINARAASIDFMTALSYMQAKSGKLTGEDILAKILELELEILSLRERVNNYSLEGDIRETDASIKAAKNWLNQIPAILGDKSLQGELKIAYAMGNVEAARGNIEDAKFLFDSRASWEISIKSLGIAKSLSFFLSLEREETCSRGFYPTPEAKIKSVIDQNP